MSRIYLNNNWKFTENFEQSMIQSSFQDANLETVRLPHTCKELPFHYFDEHLYQMLCGYRKTFAVPEEWRGKSVVLTIDGAAHSAWVYLNGKKIGEHHCGYTAFSMELKETLNYGAENVLVISVNSREDQNIPPFGFVIDYMTYGGIYRDVYLDVREPEYLENIFVTTDLGDSLKNGSAEKGKHRYPAKILSRIRVRTGKQNHSGMEPLFIRQSLIQKDTREEIFLGETRASENMEIENKVENILLWELDSPQLYQLKTELVRGGRLLDARSDTFGFRKAEFKKDGFYLNGNKIKIRGLNRHQSYPYVGYAMPASMQKLDADVLKFELGCNAVRTSHYPQSHYFMERCDEIGLMTFMEIPGWQHIGDAEWKNQAIENVRDMILQYRNHTSVILWGVRINESQDDDEFYQRTNALAHELDDSRSTGGVRAHKKSHLFEDVYTYNDFSHDGEHPGCEPKKNVTSDVESPYLVTEYNGHMYPTKAFDCEEHRMEHALRHAAVLDAVAGQGDIAGSFGWCMFDYNTHKDFGSGDRICYHGVMDMFRNPKLGAAVYACEQDEETVLELSSSMDIGEHPASNRGFTYIFSNADSVRMYKNDKFIKEYTRADSPFRNLKHGPMVLNDFIGDEKDLPKDVKFALNYAATHGYGKLPLKIIGIGLKCILFRHMKPSDIVELYNKYIGDWGSTSTVYQFEAIKDGKVVKTIRKEPMTYAHMEAQVSSRELTEINSYDVAEIRIRILDENGNQLFYCSDPIMVKTEGPVEIIGPSTIPVRGGAAGLYVKTAGQCGRAAVTLHCEWMEDLRLEFQVSV